MTELPPPESETEHAVRNQLAIIVGFADLLLGDLPDDNALRKDVEEIRKAGLNALALMPNLVERSRSSKP